MPKHKPATDATELSPTAITILQAAAAREDGALRPLAVRMPPTAERAVLAKLREAGLTETAQLESGLLERIAERGRTRLAMRALRAALEGQATSVVAGAPDDGARATQEAADGGGDGDGPLGSPATASGCDSAARLPHGGDEDEAFEPPAFLRRGAGAGSAIGPEDAGEPVAADALREEPQARGQRRRGKPTKAASPARAERVASDVGRPVPGRIRRAGQGAPAHQTKGARLLELLRRSGGASIDEITGEFGWLAHTARARIAVDVRGRGHPVVTERVERGGRRVTVYRVGPSDPG